MHPLQTPSDSDMNEFLKVQEQIANNEGRVIDVAKDAKEEKKPFSLDSFFDEILKAFGAPRTVEINGVDVVIDEPLVDDVTSFISKLASISTSKLDQASGKGAEVIVTLIPEFKALIVASIQIEGIKPGDRLAWFGGLKTSQGIRILREYTKVVDMGAIIRLGKSLK